MALIHIYTDTTVHIMRFGKYVSTIPKNETFVLDLSRGRHIVCFISDKYDVAVSQKHVFEIPDNNFEDYYEVHLFDAENQLRQNLESYRDGEQWIIDDEGNYYSPDWKRLFKGANKDAVHIDSRCCYICSYAFQGNKDIKYVYLPNSIVGIGYSAFEYCEALSYVYGAKTGVASYVASYAFCYCKKLQEINLQALFHISDSLLSSCDDLRKVILNPGLLRIGKYAFFSCKSLKSIELPNTVLEICEKAFDSSALESISLPEGIETIAVGCFSCCKNLSSINLPTTLSVIKEDAFNRCESLDNVIIPSSVQAIGNNAFYGCKELKSLSLNEGICTIGKNAFSRCESLRCVTIPASVTSIMNGAFTHCMSLERFDSKYAVDDIYLICENCLISVAHSRASDCITVPQGVTKIGDEAFAEAKYLKKVNLPDSLIAIGNDAFSGCNSLTAITMPQNLESIGNNAFWFCESLEQITLPHTIKSIGHSAFVFCARLTDIRIPNGVKSIESSTFNNCNSLKEIAFPEGVISLDITAVGHCHNLVSISIPKSLKYIVTDYFAYRFTNCPNLARIYYSIGLSENLINQLRNAFDGELIPV